MKVLVCCTTKDRHSELALLLQGLRTQTHKEWDLFLLDESQTPVQNCQFIIPLLNRIKLEGHAVKLVRNFPSLGVCNARNLMIKNSFYHKGPLILRIDDETWH